MKKSAKRESAIPSKDMADVLASFAPEVRNLSLAARAFVLKAVPALIEIIDARARIIGYGYSPKYTDMVCVSMPTKAGVTFGIGYAAQLPDPEKILERAGKVHRHVKLKSKADLQRAALRALLHAASDAAITRRGKPGQKPKKKQSG
jgi:Domain of unknown function (DU1801)